MLTFDIRNCIAFTSTLMKEIASLKLRCFIVSRDSCACIYVRIARFIHSVNIFIDRHTEEEID